MKTKRNLNNLFYKRIICTIVGSLLLASLLNAATNVPAGNVSRVWTLANSPYLIEGDITVPEGETLTIEPGVVVEFQYWYKLTVNGDLQAVGTNIQQIVFTSTPHGPGEPAWAGIDLINTMGNCRFEYCIIENGHSMSANPNDRGGAINILNSSPTIKNCTLRSNHVSKYGGAIYSDGGDPVIESCTITNNSVGTGATASGGAIYIANSTHALIKGNNISNNSADAYGGFSTGNANGGAIYLDHADIVITGNVISYNSLHAEGNIPNHTKGRGNFL